MSYGGSGGGSGKIATSADVALNSPTDGQSLTYNATTQKWVNSTVTGGGSAGATYTQIINVRDYGATGVESQDATTIVKNAIAAIANKQNQAGVVYFPAGVYIVNDALAIPAHIYLEGESASSTSLRLYTNKGSTPFLTFGTSGNISTYSGIRRMNIDAETNAEVAVRMYGPQEGSTIAECLISGATVRTIEIKSQNIEGGSNKFVFEKNWVWVNGDNGMAGIQFDPSAGPLIIRDTTFVGINRSASSGGPAGSAGIITNGGFFQIENVNCEKFESHTNATTSNLSMDSVTNFFCTYGITLSGNDGATVVTNAGFDNVTACLRNTTSGNTVGFFKNYRGEAYPYDRRSYDQNWWALGAANVYGSDTSQTQMGYSVFGNSDTARYKINTIQSGSSWTEVANIDSSLTFGTGGSAYNGQHLRLGAYHLWIDANGRLRVKGSAPTADTDGTIVGTQS